MVRPLAISMTARPVKYYVNGPGKLSALSLTSAGRSLGHRDLGDLAPAPDEPLERPQQGPRLCALDCRHCSHARSDGSPIFAR